jgi:hypothetical protein|tara:strand:- start:129 stop:500 length:372 start_codon:yes stop_codon:yes gene_type:complete
MAISVKSSGVSSPFSVRGVEITDLENTGLSDFLSASTTIYTLDLDNAANGALTFFKVYDNASPTYGTTDPVVMIQVAASTRQVWSIAQGLSLTNGLSMMACTVDGAASGSNPGSNFNCSLVVS